MSRYSDEFKEQVVRKMMPPNAQSVAQVHRETGISEPTLYAWRNRYRAEGQVVPADPSNLENWSGENKQAVVIETAISSVATGTSVTGNPAPRPTRPIPTENPVLTWLC